MDEKKLWDKFGGIQKATPFSFGSYYSYQFRNTPWHILFTLSRYKFASKMIGANRDVLELGCNEGLGSYYLSEFAHHVHGVDFDKEAIAWAKENLESEKLSFKLDNFLGKKYGEFDAVVAFDTIEHTFKRNEDLFLETICRNLSRYGIAIVGTPNIMASQYSSPIVNDTHVNMYDAERLEGLMNKYFHNVSIFSQNDEVIHTGFPPMAHYLIAVGSANYKLGR